MKGKGNLSFWPEKDSIIKGLIDAFYGYEKVEKRSGLRFKNSYLKESAFTAVEMDVKGVPFVNKLYKRGTFSAKNGL